MLDPILTPSIPHSTLYLPPELVGQILQDSSLSKSDLARCCLINYDFLYGARPLLYAELRVCITWAVVTGWWVLDRGNELLFQTLSETPSLGQYARKASLFTTSIDEEGTGVYNGPTYNDFGKPVKQALEIMPRLESLKLSEYVWNSDRAKELILDRGSQWRELVIEGTLLKEDTDGNGRTWSKLRNLKKLRCEVVNRNNGDTPPIPDHLEVLDITSSYPQDFPFPLAPRSQLRVLRVIPSNSNLQHSGCMGQLRHLYLFIRYYTSVLSSETLSSLSRLPLLESLSVEYYGPTRLGDSLVDSLLHHLPRSLLRLDFPRCYPFDALKDSLRTDTIPRLRILGLARLSVSEELERGVVVLRQICEGKGVAIERIILREDIFLV